MDIILQWDRALLHLINGQWHNGFFDWLLPMARNKYYSIPLYLFLIIYASFKRKGNNGWWMIFGGAMPILTDFVSSKLIKKNIWRLRPCADPVIGPTVRDLIHYCPEGSSSFTSSHAATHMGMAVFFYLTLRKFMGNWALLFFVWALVIMYAQVYVAVHYPTDVVCGAIVGALIGWGMASLYQRKYSLA